MSIELSKLYAELEEDDGHIQVSTLCEAIGVSVNRMDSLSDQGVFSSTPGVYGLQPTNDVIRTIPAAVSPALGAILELDQILNLSVGRLTEAWESLVDSYVDCLMVGDAPGFIVVTANDIEVLLGDEFEYHLDPSKPFSVIPIREELQHLGGWK